jgi:hypothetical protein
MKGDNARRVEQEKASAVLLDTRAAVPLCSEVLPIPTEIVGGDCIDMAVSDLSDLLL